MRVPDRYELAYLNVTSSSEAVPHATVRVKIDGEERTEHATGDGMVDACYQAIAKATGTTCKLERYAVKAITGGTDAQGEVSCLVRDDDGDVDGAGRAHRHHHGERAGVPERPQQDRVPQALRGARTPGGTLR